MSLVRFYLYRDSVLIPNVVRAQEGFYLDQAPVTCCELADEADLVGCLTEALSSDNEVVPTPEREESGGSVILEALSLKKWHQFESQALMYTVHAEVSGTAFYGTGRGANGLWRRDPVRQWHFGPDVAVSDVVRAIIIILQQDQTTPPVYVPALPSPLPPALPGKGSDETAEGESA